MPEVGGNILLSDTMSHGFQFRILVADDDETLLASTAAVLAREGYVVLTARDGFEALVELQGSVPEIVISDLEMPNMSGFEFLAVVRRRFPSVGVIAQSGEFSPVGMPEGVLADRFIRKGENSPFELLETVRELLSQRPIRAAQAKPEIAPAWIPRTTTGYVVITCLSCLRSSSVRTRDIKTGVTSTSSCLHCGAEISYCLDSTTASDGDKTSVSERAQGRTNASRRTVSESQKAIAESRTRITKE